MRGIRFLLLVSAALVATLVFAAERAATISGVVKFEDGKPAEGVYVVLDGFIIQATTNKEGKYTLKGIPWGLYTIVAVLPAYKPSKRMNLDVKRNANLKDINLVLEKDPNYHPDVLKLDQLNPAPDSILPPNKDIEFQGVVRYELRNHRNAKVVLSFEDDRKNLLLTYQPRYDIQQGSASFPFRRALRTPARFGNAEIYLSAAIIPVSLGPIAATEVVTYQVRTFNDDMKFAAVALSRDEARADSATISAALDYVLESIEKGTVRLRVQGDEGKGDFPEKLLEDSKPVDKAQSANGILSFAGSFRIPAKVKKLRLRVDLIPDKSIDAKLVKYSKTYAPPRAEKK